MPYPAKPLVEPSTDVATSVTPSLEMTINTAPFDTTAHPATTVPTGLVNGLPTGLMIIGRHYADACLTIAEAVERQAAGFPHPSHA